MSTQPPRPFTGRHMTAIMVGFFAVVIAVNLFMARQASATFGGVVVDNSYVASQHFNRWLDEAAAERALGWKATAVRMGDGHVSVELSGLPQGAVSLSATARHPLGREPDRTIRFVRQTDGRFVSDEPLPPGRWLLRTAVSTQDRTWRTQGEIR